MQLHQKKLNLSSTKCQIYFIFSKTALKYEWESEDENGTMSDWAGSTLAGGTPNYYALHLLYQHVHANLDLSSQDANLWTYQHIFSHIFTCYKYMQYRFTVKHNWVDGIKLRATYFGSQFWISCGIWGMQFHRICSIAGLLALVGGCYFGDSGCYLVECCIFPATDCIARPHFEIDWKQFWNAKPMVGVCNPHNTSQ